MDGIRRWGRARSPRRAGHASVRSAAKQSRRARKSIIGANIAVFLIVAFGLLVAGIFKVVSQDRPPQILRFIEGVLKIETPL